jgi:hypothetical protein
MDSFDVAETLEAQLALLFDGIEPSIRTTVIRSHFEKRGLAIVDAYKLHHARSDFNVIRDKLVDVENLLGLPRNYGGNTQSSGLSNFMGNPFPFSI